MTVIEQTRPVRADFRCGDRRVVDGILAYC